MNKKLLLAVCLSAALAIAASFWASGSAFFSEGLRWLTIALLALYATSRRSLTGWIFVGLLAGAEFGHDWPSMAVGADVRSQRCTLA